MARLDGRTVLITGGTGGIGLGIARRAVADGARVVLTGRNRDRMNLAVAELGGQEVALGVQGGVDDVEHQALAVRAAIESFGSLDVLVNNAAISPSRAFCPLVQLDLDVATGVLNANVVAALSWVQAALSGGGLRRRGASIVNITSGAANGPTENLGLYGLSKNALVYLTKQLASELAPDIRVNSVSPATVRTHMSGPMLSRAQAETIARLPMARIGETSDIAAAVSFLCSDDAAWVTGVNLDVDGGYAIARV